MLVDWHGRYGSGGGLRRLKIAGGLESQKINIGGSGSPPVFLALPIQTRVQISIVHTE